MIDVDGTVGGSHSTSVSIVHAHVLPDRPDCSNDFLDMTKDSENDGQLSREVDDWSYGL